MKSVQGNYTTYYIGNYYEYTQQTDEISNLTITPRGYGVACQDGASGNGYILYSAESVHTRFADNAPEIHNANHFICVIYDGENWKYDNDTAYYTFTPRETDILIAEVNFTTDAVHKLNGHDSVVNGIIYGYASGNLTITVDQWNGQYNDGEFELGNNYIVPNQMVTVSKYYYAGAMRIAVRKLSIVSYLQVDELYYLFGDHLGSTSVSYLVGGTNTDFQTYKPWGEVLTAGTLPTKYTFTGQYSEVDLFGLVYYNARWYDPALGRFMQADSVIPGKGNPQAWDRFAYTANNPINLTDPTGHATCDEDGKCYEGGELINNIIQTGVPPLPKSIDILKMMILKKFGITMSDSSNREWSVSNLQTVYNALIAVDGVLKGNLKLMVGGTTFTIVDGGNQYYGQASAGGVNFHTASSNTQLPLINILHETGHLLDMVPATSDAFSSQIDGTPDWVDTDGYVDREILKNQFDQPVQAKPMNESFEVDEYWADAFANYVAGNIDMGVSSGKNMSAFVIKALAPYADY